jgi:hypothetical protein
VLNGKIRQALCLLCVRANADEHDDHGRDGRRISHMSGATFHGRYGSVKSTIGANRDCGAPVQIRP